MRIALSLGSFLFGLLVFVLMSLAEPVTLSPAWDLKAALTCLDIDKAVQEGDKARVEALVRGLGPHWPPFVCPISARLRVPPLIP